MVKKFKFDPFGYEVVLNKFAQQADGSVWLKQGGTVVLATAVSAPSDEFPGFLPLTVDYREYFSAAGKIPGGYFKREGRPLDREILTSRLIDRAIRPLFPANYFNQVQVIATVYSVDKDHLPGPLALVASSLALSISKIPFLGPLGAIEVCNVNGELIFGPTYDQTKEAGAKFTIAGTQEGISMVEGSADELDEAAFIDLLFKAHEKIKELATWQIDIQKQVGVAKEAAADVKGVGWESKVEENFWPLWQKRADAFLTEARVKSCYIADKEARNEQLAALKTAFQEEYATEVAEKDIPTKVINYILDAQLKEKITELIFSLKKRIDDRDYSDIRPITSEVGLLPAAHGSALFTRGQTQALSTVTLGSGEDEQRIESIMEDEGGMNNGRFMLHYNFPPFSVGEARFLRGPGRREVGHGYLAASAIKRLLPDRNNFPYTVRIVTDILESNGSSSMATVCGSTLALMDAGVPIKSMVSGIAMGLLQNKAGDFIVLSDINGFEDAFGLMDFKVAGTTEGITAIQMDVKYKGGLSREILAKALEQAHKGRLFILDKMKQTLDEPRQELSQLVPRFVTLKIASDKIGAIIGSGGKTIREITEKTETSIDIEPDGTVQIFGVPGADIDRAVRWVKTLAGQIESGSRYTGKIRKVADFGLFVELVPGQDGLVHVSNIPREKQRNFMHEYHVDDVVTVEVVEYDPATDRVRLRLVDEQKSTK